MTVARPEIIKDFPPNISEIRQYLTPPPQAIFAYKGKIYNPSGDKVRADIEFHEMIHFRQGADDLWWTRYLTDKEFRKSQEVEAYAHQMAFLRRNLPENITRELLDDISTALSRDYDLDITSHQARSLIRHFPVS